MFKRLTILLSFIIFYHWSVANTDNPIQIAENRICILIDSLEQEENFTRKKAINANIDSLLHQILCKQESADYEFTKLQKISIIATPNRDVRVFTWNLPLAGGYQQYFGYIQSVFNNEVQVFRLEDSRKDIATPQIQTLPYNQWYGALYYAIRVDYFGGEQIFTLLGVDFNSPFSSKRIIETLAFSENGDPYFGVPIFNVQNNWLKRIVFEYSARAGMSLQWNTKLQMIVFDHLSPIRNDYMGNFQFYVPDMSYDAFRPMENGWEYVADVDIRNPDKPRPARIIAPEENIEPGFLYRP